MPFTPQELEEIRLGIKAELAAELRAKQAAYREANKDKIKAQRAAYRAANKDKIKAYQAAYRAANKDKIKA